MKVYLVTGIGSFFIGGFVSLMMVRSAVKADREYTLSKFSAVSDKLETISNNTEPNRYEFCNHD